MPKNAINQKKSIFSKSHDGIQIVPLILNFPNCPGPPRRKFGRGYHSMYLELDSGTVVGMFSAMSEGDSISDLTEVFNGAEIP